MAVDLLDAPLRISWDIFSDHQTSLTTEQLCHIADEVTAAGVFFVSLENNPLKHTDINIILEQLLAGGCQINLVVDSATRQFDALNGLPDGINLYIDAAGCIENNSPDLQALGELFQQIRNLQLSPSLCWIPQAGQLALILDFIEFCRRWQVPCFKLPNQKIDANSGVSSSKHLPVSDDLDQFAKALQGVRLPDSAALKLEVHDLFLWELLQPLSGGQRSEYGGCQAGNSLGHIDASGQLLPCSSWPQPLGSLLTGNLHDLWQSAQRMKIINRIAAIPPGCDGCRDYNICFGGCRGLSAFCRSDSSGRDLLCAERR